jgi:hypothetical protein
VEPVGRFVTTSPESSALDKALQQQRSDPVATGEIGPDMPDAGTQNHGGEIGRANPGWNEKAPVVDHLAQARLFLPGVPADEPIPVGKRPCAGS